MSKEDVDDDCDCSFKDCEGVKSMTDEELAESLQESIERALNGESASKEEVEEFFSEC